MNTNKETDLDILINSYARGAGYPRSLQIPRELVLLLELYPLATCIELIKDWEGEHKLPILYQAVCSQLAQTANKHVERVLASSQSDTETPVKQVGIADLLAAINKIQ